MTREIEELVLSFFERIKIMFLVQENFKFTRWEVGVELFVTVCIWHDYQNLVTKCCQFQDGLTIRALKQQTFGSNKSVCSNLFAKQEELLVYVV